MTIKLWLSKEEKREIDKFAKEIIRSLEKTKIEVRYNFERVYFAGSFGSFPGLLPRGFLNRINRMKLLRLVEGLRKSGWKIDPFPWLDLKSGIISIPAYKLIPGKSL